MASSDQSNSSPSNAGDAANGAPAMAQQPVLATAASAQPTAAALAAAHGAGITAQLASQIARQASAQRGSFDFALDPQGLGRVDVSLKIDPQGQLSAVLSFDNPAAAAEAKSRASDLQQALQQAGFQISQNNLSFTGGGAQGGDASSGQGQFSRGSQAAGYSQATASSTDSASPSPASSRATPAGALDITI